MATATAPKPTQATLSDLLGTLPIPQYRLVPVDAITVPEGSPEPSRALVESVRSLGVQVPVILVPMPIEPSEYACVAGGRRVQAARLASWGEVPALIYDDLDGAAQAALVLTENLVRGSNPLSELEAVERLMGRWGMDEKAIAATLRLPIVTVRNALRCAGLVPELRAVFGTRALPRGIGLAAARLPQSTQERLAERLAAGERLTGADVREERTARAQQAAAAALPFEDAGPEIDEQAEGDAVEILAEGIHKALGLLSATNKAAKALRAALEAAGVRDLG